MNEALSWKQVVANTMSLLSGTVLSRALSAVILILVARQIGREAYGQYASSIALVGLVAIISSLGLEKWMLYQGSTEREQMDLWFTSAFVLSLLLGGVWIAGLLLVTPYLNAVSFPWTLMVLASFSLCLEQSTLVIWSVFKADLRNNLASALMVFSQGFFLILCIWLVLDNARAPREFMGAKLVAALLTAAASAWAVSRKPGFRLQPRAMWAALGRTLPFAASTGFTVIYGRADLAIVGHELGKGAAGIYAPALTLTNTLFLIPAAIYEALVPVFSREYARRGTGMGRIALRVTLLMLLIGIILGAGLSWVSEPLVKLLYGADFVQSGDVLELLSQVLILRCPTIALSAVLVAAGWQSQRVAVQAVAAGLNVALNFAVVHPFGLTGVARVYLFTEAVLLLGHLGLFLSWIKTKRRVP